MKTLAEKPRERIISTAIRLFNSVGVHATGIDRIIEEAGVTKKTFYHHFPSKNKLISEYFSKKDELWFRTLKKYSSDVSQKPIDQFLGVFDGLQDWFLQSDFYGCPFIRGLSDFSEEKNDPEINQKISQHFSETMKYLEILLKKVRPKDYKIFLPQMMSLIAGATIVAQATGDSKIAQINKIMAKNLLAE